MSKGDVKNVLMAVPTTREVARQLFLKTFMWLTETRHNVSLFVPDYKCNENNYQNVAKHFWENDYDYLIQIDDDNPPCKSPFDLIDEEKDIIILPTPIWFYEGNRKGKIPFQFNIYNSMDGNDKYVPAQPGSGLQRIKAGGAGALVISRKVFESPKMRQEAWHRRWNKEDGTQKRGLDIAFCERATKCGFEIWTHWDYRCHHIKKVDLLDVHDGFRTWLVNLLVCNNGVLTLGHLGMSLESILEEFSSQREAIDAANIGRALSGEYGPGDYHHSGGLVETGCHRTGTTLRRQEGGRVRDGWVDADPGKVLEGADKL